MGFFLGNVELPILTHKGFKNLNGSIYIKEIEPSHKARTI